MITCLISCLISCSLGHLQFALEVCAHASFQVCLEHAQSHSAVLLQIPVCAWNWHVCGFCIHSIYASGPGTLNLGTQMDCSCYVINHTHFLCCEKKICCGHVATIVFSSEHYSAKILPQLLPWLFVLFMRKWYTLQYGQNLSGENVHLIILK